MTLNTVTQFNPRQSEDVHKHRKESSFRRQLTLVDLSDGENIVTARFYGKGSRNYCCVWFGRTGQHARGSAWAGGYGYHKDSCALESALNVAGMTFRDMFGGTGETGERAALEAIARWLDVPAFTIVQAHG